MHVQCTAPEEWRPVVGFENRYEVSSLGRVRRSTTGGNTWPGRVLKPRSKTNGRLTVSLDGHEHYINRLVASAFIRPPVEREEANHVDGDRQNNRVTNLEWTTRLGNIRHAWEHGLKTGNLGQRNGRTKLTAAAVTAIRRAYADGDASLARLGAEHGISAQSVYAIVKRKNWQHVP